MNQIKTKQLNKQRRVARTRAKISGTAIRPRLSVSRSNLYVFAQLIDDTAGKTIVSAHSKALIVKGKKTDTALALGEALAKKALAAGIKQAVFDRRGNRYHGRIKAVAEGARQNGLTF